MKKFLFAALGLIFMNLNAVSQIPNADMETWTHFSQAVPDEWETHGIISQVTPGAQGTYAVKIKANPNNHNDIGAIVYGNTENNNLHGGIPYTQRPDSFVGYFQYDIKPGDSGWVIIMFQQGGAPMSSDIYYLTGAQTSGLKRMAFKINYMRSGNPDSVFIGVTSNSPNGQKYYDSYVIVDNLFFTNATQVIPNFSFENWITLGYDIPDGWYGHNDFISQPVQKTTDAYMGTYALKIQNVLSNNGNQAGFCATVKPGSPDSLIWQPKPSFPVSKKPDTLYFYMKFLPQEKDTASIYVQFYNKGTPVGSGYLKVGNMISKYAPTKIPINYNNSQTPDSAYISLTSFAQNGQGNPDLGESVLYVDNLNFEKLISSIDAGKTDDISLKIYPNPAHNQLYISGSPDLKILKTELTDMSGKVVGNFISESHVINLSGLHPGIYIVLITTTKGVISREFKKY